MCSNVYGDVAFKSMVLRQDVPPARHAVTTRVVTGVVPGVVTGVVPGVVTDRCYRPLLPTVATDLMMISRVP